MFKSQLSYFLPLLVISSVTRVQTESTGADNVKLYFSCSVTQYVRVSASGRVKGRDRAHSCHLLPPPPAALERETWEGVPRRDKRRAYFTRSPQKCLQEAALGLRTLQSRATILKCGHPATDTSHPECGHLRFSVRPSSRRLCSAGCLRLDPCLSNVSQPSPLLIVLPGPPH